ncbi:MAG: thiamine phosphate synthase [Spirochaetae bacterium HGW-Spirochaetae-1]|jgi:thiamine-phosphate pyrophosphorylase|nr:MAG: thiamine phosphate synthase [Spirochaetae bacterium HGW-Spirochaetae-1]
MTDAILTAVDANFNRAMEGLRVCEDALRFAAHSPHSVKFKELRHALNSLMKGIPPHRLLRARDVEGDGQKFVDLPTEQTREAVPDLVRANIHRAIEAIRCIEEYSKIQGTEAAGLAGRSGAFQRLRFELYDLEKVVILGLCRQEKRDVFRNALYAILDSAFVEKSRLEETCLRLIKGGAAVIQLRMKNEPRREIYSAAGNLCRLCHEQGRLFIVNDYPDIAEAVDADGIHLGQDDIPLAVARGILAADRIIGISTHSVEQAIAAAAEGPDYIAIGPIFDTSSKNGDLIRGIGTAVIGKIRDAVDIPLVCIGGITGANTAETAVAGCTCPAVISALYKDDSVEENCRTIIDKLR